MADRPGSDANVSQVNGTDPAAERRKALVYMRVHLRTAENLASHDDDDSQVDLVDQKAIITLDRLPRRSLGRVKYLLEQSPQGKLASTKSGSVIVWTPNRGSEVGHPNL